MGVFLFVSDFPFMGFDFWVWEIFLGEKGVYGFLGFVDWLFIC